MAKYSNVDRQKPREIIKSEPTEKLYIVLDDFDLSFYQSEINAVKEYWRDNIGIKEIANRLNREVEEVFCLLLDLTHKGIVKEREVGLGG